MRTRATCFISYCHEDIDRQSIDALVNFIVEKITPDGTVYYDQTMRAGARFTDFMSQIDKVDGVILILTPQYRTQILKRSGGAYHEFKLILDRLEQLEEMKRQQSSYHDDYVAYWPFNFELVPILFSGEVNSSVPDEIRDYRLIDMRRFRASRRSNDGATFLSDSTRRFASPLVDSIFEDLTSTNIRRSAEFRTTYRDLYTRLFIDLKSEHESHGNSEEVKVDKYIFVKTHAFKNIRDQRAFILVGRKGSGKSTVVYYLPRISSEYTGQISIIADKFGLQKVFFELDYDQIRQELKGLLTHQQLFYMAWSLMVTILTADAIVAVAKAGKLHALPSFLQSKLDDFVRKFRTGWSGGSKLDQEALFIYCQRSAVDFLNRCIDEARPEDDFFLSDIVTNFRTKIFLKTTIGDDVQASIAAASRFGCKLVLSLDGFDTAFQDFRRDRARTRGRIGSLHDRPLIEIDWLRAFVRLVTDIQIGKRREPTFALLRPCVTIPKDRFIEVLQSERDAHIYERRYLDLHWSGIELAILLRKRVEILANLPTDKGKSPRLRLEMAFAAAYPQLPTHISGIVGGHKFEIPTFLYVLRHTFWRPREILFYYASLLAAAVQQPKGSVVSVNIVRKIVSETTFLIVHHEFIGEFKDTLRNLEDVLACFDHADQVMEFGEFSRRIYSIDFDFSWTEAPVNDIEEKLSFLFEIGFFGFIPDDMTRLRFQFQMNEVFSFNEGMTLLKTHNKSRFRGFQLVIHPIFCEYLHLDTTNCPFTLNYTWEFLIDHEKFMFSLS